MTGPSGPASGEPEREEPADAPPDRLERSRSYGTAIGAAMLGLEQALRSQPPPEVLAVEHAPARGLSGQDEDIVLSARDDGRVVVYDAASFAELARLPAESPSGIFLTSRGAMTGF